MCLMLLELLPAMINAALGAAELGVAANGPNRPLALDAFAGDIADRLVDRHGAGFFRSHVSRGNP